MAKNLRAKMPEGDTLTVFDVNQSSLDTFSKEAVPAGVVIAKNPREVVENAVSGNLPCPYPMRSMMRLLFYL